MRALALIHLTLRSNTILAVGFNLQPKRAEGPQAEGWTAVAVGQTQLLSAAKKRRAERSASCETARPAYWRGSPKKTKQ